MQMISFCWQRAKEPLRDFWKQAQTFPLLPISMHIVSLPAMLPQQTHETQYWLCTDDQGGCFGVLSQEVPYDT